MVMQPVDTHQIRPPRTSPSYPNCRQVRDRDHCHVGAICTFDSLVTVLQGRSDHRVGLVGWCAGRVSKRPPCQLLTLGGRSGRSAISAGDSITAKRPDIETFGENVGTLTSEVFGLEVTNSGFHRMLAEAAAGELSYGEVLDTFHGQLGSEARPLLQALIAVQGRGY